jgi:ATP synthase protein I
VRYAVNPFAAHNRAFRELHRGSADSHYLFFFQWITLVPAFLDSVESCQYGPRGFKGRACLDYRKAASVESMSDGARENGDRGNRHSDEAALSARLQRLNEGLGQARRADQPSDGPGDDGATTASGYARGFRLSSELVAGVLVGAGLGWLLDRWLGISPWGLIVFLLLGFAAGVLNVMRSAGLVAGGVLDGGAPENRRK